jgi:HSP20 family protein
MALPTRSTDNWLQGLGTPSQLFGRGGDTDVELYEEDGEFVLTVEMPGFDREEIDVNWHEGRLRVSAEHVDEGRNRKRTYHRTFRMPRAIEPEDVTARYRNGVLEVTLPAQPGASEAGHSIEVEG